jgi:hypothetical protein
MTGAREMYAEHTAGRHPEQELALLSKLLGIVGYRAEFLSEHDHIPGALSYLNNRRVVFQTWNPGCIRTPMTTVSREVSSPMDWMPRVVVDPVAHFIQLASGLARAGSV